MAGLVLVAQRLSGGLRQPGDQVGLVVDERLARRAREGEAPRHTGLESELLREGTQVLAVVEEHVGVVGAEADLLGDCLLYTSRCV